MISKSLTALCQVALRRAARGPEGVHMNQSSSTSPPHQPLIHPKEAQKRRERSYKVAATWAQTQKDSELIPLGEVWGVGTTRWLSRRGVHGILALGHGSKHLETTVFFDGFCMVFAVVLPWFCHGFA